MSKLYKSISILLICACLFTCCACTKAEYDYTTPLSPDAIDLGWLARSTTSQDLPEDVAVPTDYVTQRWVAAEIDLNEHSNYTAEDGLYVDLSVRFTNRTTGTEFNVPAFYYQNGVFKVRFAPTEYGVWDYVTICSDTELNGISGTLASNAYRGDLEIYKRGFVTTNGTKHFVYADGTPFFYLGDTHWGLYTEELDEAGPNAGDTGATSHFCYLVDKRAEQGFTVYQTEPIGFHAVLNDGNLTEEDAIAFQTDDRYFSYIAEKGLVHANAQFFWVSELHKVQDDQRYVEAISRYWVARYSAYPVLWTLAQECDNDNYFSYDKDNNPWVTVAEYIHKYDPYKHPLSGHQENNASTTVTGKGTSWDTKDGDSAFLSEEVSERTGHNWWAAQWFPMLGKQNNFKAPKDYWESNKVAIAYEMAYDYLWTGHDGARAQPWIAMLSGFAGVGYGAIDIWLYQSSFDADKEGLDGYTGKVITVEDKALPWSASIEFPSAYQQQYLKEFFMQFNWCELTPQFNSRKYFSPARRIFKSRNTASATIGNDLYVAYIYADDVKSGTIKKLDKNATYQAYWFDPSENVYYDLGEITNQRTWRTPNRPEKKDFVLLVYKK